MLIPSGKRSDKKAYFVLIGLSGAGKSSTINALFDRNTNEDDSFGSATAEILEYEIKAHENLGANVSKGLLIIDTPGFNDTRSNSEYEKDSQILATLETYLNNHHELSTCYPTAVFLIVKFDDARIEEEKSYFVLLLKTLEKLIENGTLIDIGPGSCNVIIVLTHYLNVSEELQKHPEPRIRLIQGLIKSFTSIPSNVPVVFAENKAKSFQLPNVNGYYELPNGESYPFNLFQELIKITNSIDLVGEAILTNSFAEPHLLKKKLVLMTPLLSSDHKHSKHYLDFLQYNSFEQRENDFTKTLDKIYNNLSLKVKKHKIAFQIMKDICVKENINSINEFPTKSCDLLKFLRQIPIDLMIEKTLEEIGVSAPCLLADDRKGFVGYFYNVFEDTVTSVSPFSHDEMYVSHTGFKVPKFMRADVVSNVKFQNITVVKKYQTREAYVEKRLSSLFPNIGSKLINKSFTAAEKPGHNIGNSNVIIGIREFREYVVSVTKNGKLRDSFMREMKALPYFSTFWNKNYYAWQTYFGKHGTHFVKSGYLGGYIMVTAEVAGSSERAPNDDVIQVVQEMLDSFGAETNYTKFNSTKGWKFNLELFGGDTMSKPNVNLIYKNDGAKIIADWLNSLQASPVPLYSEIRLEHISALLPDADKNISKRASTAAHHLFGYNIF